MEAITVLKAIQNKKFNSPILRNINITKKRLGLPKAEPGACGVVVQVGLNGQNKALRVSRIELKRIQQRYQLIINYLRSNPSPYFINLDYYKSSLQIGKKAYDCIVMDWVEGKDMKSYVETNLYNSTALNKLADDFLKMVCYLHSKQIAHGDLHHGNILVLPNGQIKLIDYDSLYVPTLGGSFLDSIKGKQGYQHSKRIANQYSNQYLDYFSEWVIYLSLKALAERPSLWTKYKVKGKNDGFLFDIEDLKKPSQSTLFTELGQMSGTIQNIRQQLINAINAPNIQAIQSLTNVFSCSNVQTTKISSVRQRIVPIPNILKKNRLV